MPKPITEEKARLSLAALCARGEHCTGELDDKMRRWGLDDESRHRIMDYLTSQHFVDDERFCRAYVADKIAYNRWGRRKIEQALWLKHIPADVSGPVLDSVTDDQWLDALRPVLKAKWPSIKATTPYERSMKLIKYAMSRGFDLSIIRRGVDELSETTFIDDED